MIEYISEVEYEKRFKQWKRGRKAKPEDVESRLEMKIKSGACHLARVYETAPREVGSLLLKWSMGAEWDSLRGQFSNQFVVGPTGTDRNAIAFSGNWKDKTI